MDTKAARQSRGRGEVVVQILTVIAAVICGTWYGMVRVGGNTGSGMRTKNRCDDAIVLPSLTPWASIGGCGAGGSGGGAGGGAKWVGTGVTGGLIDAEIMHTSTVGQNYRFKTLSVRLSGKPHWKVTVGATFPWNSKIGEVQYQTNMPEKYAITGGIGDISADIGMTFGATGQFSGTIGLSFPTGQYDIKRGTDNANLYLPSNLQNGSGLYTGTLSFGYTKDVEDGILLFDVGYSHPFAMRLVSGENEFIDNYFPDGVPPEAKDNPRFYYRFKWYGENDMGDYRPPSISLSAFYGYRGVQEYVHSFGVTFAAQLGVARMHFWDPAKYQPTLDPDHQMWAGSLNYGLEFSRRKFPIFVSVIKPIHDKATADAPWKWSQPDWKDFLHSWSCAIGVKTTMFR